MKTFFEATIWPLRNQLYRMAYLWIKNRSEAEDAVQEALEKAWAEREKLQKSDNPTGWMVRVVKNQSLLKIREKKRWSTLEEMDVPAIDNVGESDHAASINVVFRFLNMLPEKQREVFHLREVEGLTYEEISGYLNISMDQVKVNLFRARRNLQKYVSKKTAQ